MLHCCLCAGASHSQLRPSFHTDVLFLPSAAAQALLLSPQPPQHWICRPTWEQPCPAGPGSSGSSRTYMLETGTFMELPVEILERNNYEQRKGEAEKWGEKSTFSEHFFLLARGNYWVTDTISCHPSHTWRTGERKIASSLWPNDQLQFVSFRNFFIFTHKPLQITL